MAQVDSEHVPDAKDIHFTTQALRNIELRGIRQADIVEALRDTAGQHVDEKTGHVVSRMGDVRIVTKREGNRVVVMTAMRRSEFSDDAG